MVVKFKIITIILFFFLSCNHSEKKLEKLRNINQDSLFFYKKIKDDSLILIKKNNEQYYKTIAKNIFFLKSINIEKYKYYKDNDYVNIKSVLLKTPTEIDFTYLHGKMNKNGIFFQSFGLTNFLEYKEPYKEYAPFINQKTKQIDFIISYDERAEIPLKISFKKGQYFWFGKNFNWITPKIEINDSSLTDYQDFNKDSFSNSDNQKMIREGIFFEFNRKKYLFFNINNGIWNIHHLFDISDDRDIKYYILNSIYTREEGYGDFNKDRKLDFKQKYYLHRNNYEKSKDKYKIYTIK